MSGIVNMKKTIFNECNIYIVLWMLYYLQGTLYESGSLISQGILSIVLLMSVINVIKVIAQRGLCGYLKGLNVLLIMFTVYGVISMVFTPTIYGSGGYTTNSFNYLKVIYLSLLPIYSFYYYAQKGKLDEKNLKVWVILFFMLAIVRYYTEQATRLMEIYGDETTNNSGYTILSLIPLIVYWREKPTLQYILLAVAMVFILMAMKRGAILIGALCVIWFLYQSFKNSNRKTKIWVFVLTVLVIAAGIYAVQYMLESSAYFVSRLEQTKDGNSSNRDVIYNSFWNYYLNETSVLQSLFGQGADASLKVFGAYAHNDWLEILINNGLIGAIIYLVYWIRFYKEWRNSKGNSVVFMVFGLTLLIYFVSTLFSMSYNGMSTYATCGFGYALGIKNLQIKKQKI